jgi:hypothetical protein
MVEKEMNGKEGIEYRKGELNEASFLKKPEHYGIWAR